MIKAVGDRIDVFSVLTASGAHCENVLQLVEYCRPVVVEKPMALKLDAADRMIEHNGSGKIVKPRLRRLAADILSTASGSAFVDPQRDEELLHPLKIDRRA